MDNCIYSCLISILIRKITGFRNMQINCTLTSIQAHRLWRIQKSDVSPKLSTKITWNSAPLNCITIGMLTPFKPLGPKSEAKNGGQEGFWTSVSISHAVILDVSFSLLNNNFKCRFQSSTGDFCLFCWQYVHNE